MNDRGDVIVGLFDNAARARAALAALQAAGFAGTKVSLMVRDDGLAPSSIAGGLRRIGVPDDEVAFYEDEVRRGSSLVAVGTLDRTDRTDQALAILHRSDAYDVMHFEHPGGYHHAAA